MRKRRANSSTLNNFRKPWKIKPGVIAPENPLPIAFSGLKLPTTNRFDAMKPLPRASYAASTRARRMNAKRKTVLGRLSIVVAVLSGWVGLALLLTFGSRPSRTQSVARAISVASTTSPPSLIFTQFVAGGPLTLATQALNGSLVIVTQYPVNSLTIHLPTEYFVVAPDGTRRAVSRSEFHRVELSVQGVQSLDLIDFRHQPDNNLEDLK